VQGFTLEGAKNALRQKVNETDGAAIQARLIRVRSELVSILSSL
jgi:hypothetical protein